MITSWPIIKLNEVDSTNNYATRQLTNNEIVTESVITAQNQTQGRGQRGNIWESENGKNIICSLILFTNYLLAMEQFKLSQSVSLGIVDYLKKLDIQAQVKWPNDIYVENKKIAGILIENAIMNQHLQHSVVGIGFNLNQEIFGQLDSAISLKSITGKTFDVSAETESLAECLYLRIEELKKGLTESLKQEYLDNLFGYNKLLKYKANNDIFSGKIIDIEPFGELVILADDGSLRRFMFKEVEFLIE